MYIIDVADIMYYFDNCILLQVDFKRKYFQNLKKIFLDLAQNTSLSLIVISISKTGKIVAFWITFSYTMKIKTAKFGKICSSSF